MNDTIIARARSAFGENASMAGLFCELCEELEQRRGRPLTAIEAVQLTDYVRLEQLKERADADVAARGLGKMESNGRQRYWKDNKSTVLVLKYMEQQNRILKALGLGAASAEADGGSDDDAVDEFDSI